MARSGALTPILILVFLAGACIEPPPSFRLVSLGEAQQLVRQGQVAVVEAVGAADRAPARLPGGIRWRLPTEAVSSLPEVPPGPVLVVALAEPVGYRSAAALARSRNHPVYVFIAGAEERGRLYAHDPSKEETARGRDS